MPPKGNKSGLGRALMNRRTAEVKASGTSPFHTTDMNVDESAKLRSVTHEGNLEEFLNTAQMAEQDFTAERRNNVTVITAPGLNRKNPFLLTEEEEEEVHQKQDENRGRLRVPRRPKWNTTLTKEQLDRSEKDAFLEWRRNLAELTDSLGFVLTPFERNLEVWRQLWRVIERSDLLVQIVDARNPMQFRCQDLENYVVEMNQQASEETGSTDQDSDAEEETPEGEAGRLPDKHRKRRNLLLINKADLLDEEQRRSWATYFDTQGINYAFFSASNAAAIQAANEGETLESVTTALSNLSVGGEEALLAAKEARDSKEASRILTVDELETLFERSAPPPEERASATGHSEQGKLVVGLVGYPNVGKSSTINALIGSKKVSVSSTPGKTKHFQTLHLSDSTILCDCPGLVFPQFATTAADLVVDGVLPIDQLREYTAPAQLVAQRIPQDILEATYSIQIPTDGKGPENQTSGLDLLAAYAVSRGFTRQGQGNPDETRAARYVLKDYVNARLLFAHPPEGVDPDEFNAAQRDRIRASLAQRGNRVHSLISDAVAQRVRTNAAAMMNTAPRPSGKKAAARQKVENMTQDVDSDFFASAAPGPKIRGKNPMAALRGRINNDGTINEDDDALSISSGLSNSKKHNKGSGGKKKKQHNPNPYGV